MPLPRAVQSAWLVACSAGRVAIANVVVFAFVAAAPAPAGAQRALSVVGSDSALDAPPSFPAGLVAVRFASHAKHRRELVVRRIPTGRTAEELVRGAAGRPSAWFNEWSFGGPTLGDSATEGTVAMELRPGRYLLVSYEVDAAGRPRGDRLVWRPVSAVPAAILISGRFPTPDVKVKIKDSAIEVAGTFQRGSRAFNIRNVGALPHELRVVRLKPGKTVDDVRRWDPASDAERPFVHVGGVTPLSPSREAQTRLVLQSGEYVVLCAMRDARERRYHYQNGLLASFHVN